MGRRAATVTARSVKGIVADQRILGAIGDTPRTAREIADVLFREVLGTWRDEKGYDFEYFTDEEPLGARLLAISTAEERGLVYLAAHEVYPRLRGLERRGLVERITPPRGRGILWRATPTGG